MEESPRAYLPVAVVPEKPMAPPEPVEISVRAKPPGSVSGSKAFNVSTGMAGMFLPSLRESAIASSCLVVS